MATEKLIRASEARKAILNADPKLAYCIDNIKAVDAVEVVHGRWINKTKEIHGMVDERNDCSVCGQVYWFACPDFNYCPNCGARMENTK